MSHDTHSTDHHVIQDEKPTSSFRSSFWLVVILAGLFIAAVNFVTVMSHDDGGHGGHGTEHTEPHTGHGGDGGHDNAGHPASAHEAHGEAATSEQHADTNHDEHSETAAEEAHH